MNGYRLVQSSYWTVLCGTLLYWCDR